MNPLSRLARFGGQRQHFLPMVTHGSGYVFQRGRAFKTNAGGLSDGHPLQKQLCLYECERTYIRGDVNFMVAHVAGDFRCQVPKKHQNAIAFLLGLSSSSIYGLG